MIKIRGITCFKITSEVTWFEKEFSFGLIQCTNTGIEFSIFEMMSVKDISKLMILWALKCCCSKSIRPVYWRTRCRISIAFDRVLLSCALAESFTLNRLNGIFDCRILMVSKLPLGNDELFDFLKFDFLKTLITIKTNIL